VPPENIIELGQLIETSSNPDAGKLRSGCLANSSVVSDIYAAGDVTIFKSVGVGVQDVAIAQAVVQRAKECDLGTTIPDYGILA
jgi:ornithine cyclodeaminase/alanine dehydrogenase-like protein (mu-crystallin family)